MDMDVSKISEIDFRVAIMKLISRLEKNINDNIESLRAGMRSNQAKLKNAMNEMQSKLDTLTARVNKAEERISELEDKMIEKKETKEALEKQIKAQEIRLREFNDAMKRSTVRIIGIPEGVKREKGLEDIFEQIIAENFPNLGKETSIHVQEAQRTPPQISKNRSTPQHIIVKLANLRAKQAVLRADGGRDFLHTEGGTSE